MSTMLDTNSIMAFIQRYKIPAALFLIAFDYYAILSAKVYTWVFTSGDSGEFMAAAHYLSLIHI